MATYQESTREIPARQVEVVVAGGGTGGAVAALAAARRGARTTLIEAKGYLGGIAVEGGTALHSFYNLWTAFPGVGKRHVVRGIPQEIVDRLAEAGGTTGHVEMIEGRDYDSICTAIDTEIYKRVLFDMLEEAGVDICVNTFLAGAIVEQGDGAGHRVRGVLAESRSGREAIYARSFVDATGYGDLAAHAGASFTEPNDYPVANSVGLGNVSLEGFYDFLTAHGALAEFARGPRSGKPGQIVRLRGNLDKLPAGFRNGAREIGMATTTTTIHDDYMMFIKLNYKMPVSPTDRNAVAAAEAELRRRQARAVELFRQYVPGCERAFIARTSPSLCIRRGRLIACDYDITLDDVLEGRHFDDDVMVYGFHDSAPRLQIKQGRTYGIPYRALLPVGVENLYVTGMMITSDHDAHMSTRNTVSCMAQGQAAGTAAALCATGAISHGSYASRELPYDVLRQALEEDGVYFET